MTAAPFDLARLGAGLAMAGVRADLEGALAGGAVVVQAPPGTGKTTLVPPVVAHAAGPGRVVVTQPRRVAVRAAARRLAQLAGEEVGARVGFTVRGERRVGTATRVEFVTPGVLLRRLLADPDLRGVAAVVLDEVHERSLETDLLVGMLAEVHGLRDDLLLVAMSATLDAPRFARLLRGADDPAPVVSCPSVAHPLDVRWAPPPGPRLDARGVTLTFLHHVAAVTLDAHRRLLRDGDGGDALVFLPGAREVAQVADRISTLLAGDRPIEVLQLHGRLAPAAQDRAVGGRGPGEPPRIVVSTDVAESSLTVPGVRLVVDTGLAREPRLDAARGMTGLVTVAASQDAARQRAGRAARLGPGVVVRCDDEDSFARRPAHPTPEIAAADLAGAALFLACWGAPEGEGLALPDPPPPAAMRDAVATLRRLGAVDAAGRATALGRRLASIPADPRLARALLDGARIVGPPRAGEVVAALADDLRAPDADLPRLLADLRRRREPGARRWEDEAGRLSALAAADPAVGAATRRADAGHDAGLVVALAHPDRIARRVGAGSHVYLLASGTRAALPPASGLSGHEWLAVADVTRADGRSAAGTGAVIRAAAPLGVADAEAAGAHLLTDEVRAVFTGGRVTARRVRALGAIELSSTPTTPEPQTARAAVARALADEGLALLRWSAAADGLRRRLAFLHHRLGAPWPDVSDAALTLDAQAWLGPELDALAAGRRADRVDLLEPLRRLLPWPAASRLDDLAPERLEVRSGSRIRVDYPAFVGGTTDPAAPPVVAVKLQECFGLAETPLVAGGRARIVVHLLSPAGRPLAVTDDLASFWSGPYAQVRAEMRGRYPKHPWPEDPWTAPPTARTTRAMRRG